MTCARVLALTLLLILPAGSQASTSDPRAVEIADRVMEALGGEDRWQGLRGLRWSFGFEQNDTVRSLRRHAWDKHTGQHRVEGRNSRGQEFCLIHDVDDGAGMAWMDGVAIEGDSLQKLLQLARRLWTNDTYWLLMPYKLRDPGVVLGYDGEVKEGATVYDKLALSFENVGQTPGDRYWVYVNRESRRIEKWEYVLEKREPPPDGSTWEGWEEHGGLWFATAHQRTNGNTFTRDIEAVTAFEPEEFERP